MTAGALLGWLAVVIGGIGLGSLLNAAADYLPRRRQALADSAALPAFSLRPNLLASPRHAALLPAGAILLAASWQRFDLLAQQIVVAAFSLVLLLVFVIDIEHRLVLNLILAPTAIAALLASIWLPGMSPKSSVLGGLIGLGLFLLIAVIGRGAMGTGDIKLAGVIGLITGYPLVLKALLIGIILGGLGTLILLIGKRVTLRSYLPYAPWLVGGALFVMFFDGRYLAVDVEVAWALLRSLPCC